jgi:hypothetical protein
MGYAIFLWIVGVILLFVHMMDSITASTALQQNVTQGTLVSGFVCIGSGCMCAVLSKLVPKSSSSSSPQT